MRARTSCIDLLVRGTRAARGTAPVTRRPLFVAANRAQLVVVHSRRPFAPGAQHVVRHLCMRHLCMHLHVHSMLHERQQARCFSVRFSWSKLDPYVRVVPEGVAFAHGQHAIALCSGCTSTRCRACDCWPLIYFNSVQFVFCTFSLHTPRTKSICWHIGTTTHKRTPSTMRQTLQILRLSCPCVRATKSVLQNQPLDQCCVWQMMQTFSKRSNCICPVSPASQQAHP